MKCFGFIPVYMSSIIIAIFNIVFGFSDLIYMIHAYSKLDSLGKRFHLSFFDIQCPSNFLHLWLSQKKGENYIIMDFVRSHHVSGKFTVYSQIYLFVSRGGGRCATAHPILSQMPIFISLLEKKKF